MSPGYSKSNTTNGALGHAEAPGNLGLRDSLSEERSDFRDVIFGQFGAIVLAALALQFWNLEIVWNSVPPGYSPINHLDGTNAHVETLGDICLAEALSPQLSDHGDIGFGEKGTSVSAAHWIGAVPYLVSHVLGVGTPVEIV
jgi:hypothetical protein